MNKSEIINYVMHTPENPNPRVLGDMLDQLETSGGGSGDITVTKAILTLDKTGGSQTYVSWTKIDTNGLAYRTDILTDTMEIELYNGSNHLYMSQITQYQGNIEYDSNQGNYIITGDATIRVMGMS